MDEKQDIRDRSPYEAPIDVAPIKSEHRGFNFPIWVFPGLFAPWTCYAIYLEADDRSWGALKTAFVDGPAINAGIAAACAILVCLNLPIKGPRWLHYVTIVASAFCASMIQVLALLFLNLHGC